MPNVAIQIHTLGTDANAVIVSVGLVVFDEKEILKEELHVVDIENQPGRTINPRSIRWWMEQDPEARKVFEENGLDVEEVIGRVSTTLHNVDGIVLISKHDQDILCSFQAPHRLFKTKLARSTYGIDDLIKVWGITPSKVRVCPKSYNALLAAQADAATLRACWNLVNEAQTVLSA